MKLAIFCYSELVSALVNHRTERDQIVFYFDVSFKHGKKVPCSIVIQV